MDTIVQWNCRGLRTNLLEITLLIQQLHPVAFCLQETHIKKSYKDNITLKNYCLYTTYVEDEERAAGGSSILINNNVIHSPVDLKTNLQAVAVRVSMEQTITLRFIYIAEFPARYPPAEEFGGTAT